MLFAIFILSFLINSALSISQHPILIIVSFDAFRFNFFDDKLTPNMLRLRKNGTYAEYMMNVFPTKTYPNHHSIATGLYPENHGVVGNIYYDPDYKKVLGMGYEMFHYDNHVIPIWRWNEDMANTRHSASMMWPGGDFPYQEKNITFSKSFELGYDWQQRVDTVISWITHPKTPVNLVMLYFEEPDTHLHAFGPNAKDVKDIIGRLDNITAYLEKQLELNHLTDKVNVIHLSDHGITKVTPPYFINATQYLTNGTYDYIGTSPILQFFPVQGYESQVYEALKNGSVESGHFKVYKKDEIPADWHFKNNDRIAPIYVLADAGYALDDLIENAPRYAKHYHFKLTNASEFGIHGFHPNNTDMHPFFMARGPKIKKQHKVATFHTVDLFSLFCEVLEIPSTKNNGSFTNVEDILITKSNGKYTIGTILIMSVGGVALAIILIASAVMFTLIMIKRQQSITTTAALNKRFPQTFQNNIEAQHLLEPEDA